MSSAGLRTTGSCGTEAGVSDVVTSDGFAVLRDPIACKPAVMAETADWVAMASEYRALAGLPGVETARVWEPEPATVYVWEQGGRARTAGKNAQEAAPR